METIKNYLEAMFANMQNTPEVVRAKEELLQMMEDKYSELIAEGASENEAVGTVISEFGNLEELGEELGISKEVSLERMERVENPKRAVSFEEAYSFLEFQKKSGFRVGLGVMLCIMCSIGPILANGLHLPDVMGVLSMFLMIGAAIGLFVREAVLKDFWKFITVGNCQIDLTTAEYLMDVKKQSASMRATRRAIGIVLCATCWIPAAVLGEISSYSLVDSLGSAFLFVYVGFGVFLLVYTAKVDRAFEILLNVNDKTKVSGSYTKDSRVEYVSERAKMIMELYWPAVVCFYLVWSFVTFQWHITWIVWVIAGVMFPVVKNSLQKQ